MRDKQYLHHSMGKFCGQPNFEVLLIKVQFVPQWYFISVSTDFAYKWLMTSHIQETWLLLCEIGTQSSRHEHANHFQESCNFCVCLKLIAQIFTENQVSRDLSHFSVLYTESL